MGQQVEWVGRLCCNTEAETWLVRWIV